MIHRHLVQQILVRACQDYHDRQFATHIFWRIHIRRKLDTKMVFESNFFMVNFVAFWENFIPFCS